MHECYNDLDLQRGAAKMHNPSETTGNGLVRMDRQTIDAAIEKYSKRIGEVIGVIDQRINDIFGAVIENLDPMHNDEQWARSSPIGSTIVYGYFQVCLISMIWKNIGMPIYSNDVAYTLNYGLNKVRFPSYLRVGFPAHGKVKMLGVERKNKDQSIWRFEVSIEQEGNPKPTMVAEAIFTILFY
jgi:acyl dehydratase